MLQKATILTALTLTRFSGLTPVVYLLKRCGPSAILGRVVAVVVSTVDGQARRTFAHVRKEVLELQPPLADLDASRSVSSELLIGGVPASVEHGSPGVPCGSATLPMSRVTGENQIALNTPATLGVPESQRTPGDMHSLAAIADALPKKRACVARRVVDAVLAKRNESAEALAGNVLAGFGLVGAVYSSWHRSVLSVSMRQAVSAALPLSIGLSIVPQEVAS